MQHPPSFGNGRALPVVNRVKGSAADQHFWVTILSPLGYLNKIQAWLDCTHVHTSIVQGSFGQASRKTYLHQLPHLSSGSIRAPLTHLGSFFGVFSPAGYLFASNWWLNFTTSIGDNSSKCLPKVSMLRCSPKACLRILFLFLW